MNRLHRVECSQTSQFWSHNGFYSKKHTQKKSETNSICNSSHRGLLWHVIDSDACTKPNKVISISHKFYESKAKHHLCARILQIMFIYVSLLSFHIIAALRPSTVQNQTSCNDKSLFGFLLPPNSYLFFRFTSFRVERCRTVEGWKT